MYVRKDVFDVQMQNLNANMERILQKLDGLEVKVADLTQAVSVMSERIDRNFDTLSARVNGLDARIDDMKQYIYWVLVLLGVVILLPSVQKFLEWRDTRKPLITLEDVKRLIEENNAKLQGKPQV